MLRSPLFLRTFGAAVALGSIAAAACANSTGGNSSFAGGDSTGESTTGGGTGTGTGALGGMQGSLGSISTTKPAGEGGARAQRCDDAGLNCTCFNIASLGYGGATGAMAGHGGSDNTEAFVNYLNSASSARVAQVGCGTDFGCTSPAQPTLTADFLNQYDVIIVQWLTNSLSPVMMNGQFAGYEGNGYWSFMPSELTALKAWVNAGGGLIFLSGYDWEAGEIAPPNQLLQAVSGMQYTATDTFGLVETGNGELCLGESNPVDGWSQTLANGMPNLLGEHITEVGAFHGRGITTGPNSVVDCTSATNGVCAAHEDVGMGHVYVYTDEWVTYTSQWNPSPQPAGYCLLDAAAGTVSANQCANTAQACPAAQVEYQVPQFWYNAISYASQATMCPFTLMGTIPR